MVTNHIKEKQDSIKIYLTARQKEILIKASEKMSLSSSSFCRFIVMQKAKELTGGPHGSN